MRQNHHMPQTDGFKSSIFFLCADESSFKKLDFLSPKERLEVFSRSKKISSTDLDLKVQKCLF